MNQSRRKFIKQTAAAAGSAGFVSMIPGALWAKHKVAPSDQVNVALIGVRNKGFGILKNHLDLPGVNVVGMCDVDKNVLQERTQEVIDTYDQKPKKYTDFRKLLEDKDLDAVIIGTPDHWHCLPTVYACEAGKDVYVEKPMANSIEECNLIVKAAQKYNRVVQVGQQQRSGVIWNNIMQHIKSGKIGTLRKVNIWANFNYGVGQPKKPDTPVPDGVDFDFWLGPAPDRNFNPTRFHGSWRHFWDYGGGLMTDWGVHLIDMALWAKDVKTAPTQVMAYGDNLSFPDYSRETFDTMSVTFPMQDYVINWQHTAGTQNGPYDMLYGMEFIGDYGTIVANRSGWKVNPEWDSKTESYKTEAKEMEKGREYHDLHSKNFIECIKSRQAPNCPAEVGRNVALYAHMGNIAVRSGTGLLMWDDDKNEFTNNKKANEFIIPDYRKPWELPKL